MNGKKKQGFFAGCACLWLGMVGLGCANEPEISDSPKRLKLAKLLPREGSKEGRAGLTVMAVFSDVVPSGNEADPATLSKATFYLERDGVIPEVTLKFSEVNSAKSTVATLELADSATLAAGRIEVVIEGTNLRGEDTLELGTDIRSWFELGP